MKKLKVNFYGEGYNLYRLKFSNEELEDIKKAVDKDFLLDDILHHPEVELANRTLDLQFSGLLNTYKNQLEIWFAGKKLEKLKLNDLNNDFIAFPLYRSTLEELDLHSLGNGIYLSEKEIGLIKSFQIISENFEMEKLIFNCVQIQFPFDSCKGVTYNGQILRPKKTDTLVIEQRYFLVG